MIVSNTSPLHYLCLIDALDVLPSLFGTVAIPHAVLSELTHPAAPATVQDWAQHLPDWLVRQRVATNIQGLDLDPGETEAISLALSMPERGILLDDRKATRVARHRGLTVTGTLGILLLGAEAGFISLPQAIERLRETTFRATPDLLRHVLDRSQMT